MQKLFVLGLAVALFACGAKHSDNAAAPASAPPTGTVTATATGKWISSCFAHEKNSVTASLELTSDGLTYAETVYYREGCAPGAEIVVYSYGYEKPAADASDLEGYQTVRFSVKNATVTLKNPSLVDIFNRDRNYDRADWELDKPTDITGRAHSKRYASVRAVGTEIAYTYRVEGDTLRLAEYQLPTKGKAYQAVASDLPKHRFTRVK